MSTLADAPALLAASLYTTGYSAQEWPHMTATPPRLKLGGERVRKESGGFYIEPTIFDGVGNKMRAGSVWVNCFDEGNIAVPFGGLKQSGIGRDKSIRAIHKYSDLKTTWIKIRK
jgi:acyl-CoA reductase-like NAD-dependent aldehyde dehydrogenase